MARPRIAVGGYGTIHTARIPGTTDWRARARYRDAGGAYHAKSKVGPTKSRATDDLEAELKRLTATVHQADITTVGDLCQQWLERLQKKSEEFWSRPDAGDRLGTAPPRPQSLVHYARAVRYVTARDGGIGDLRLGEVTTALLEAWLLDQADQSRGRAAEIRVALRGAFRSAVRLGYLQTDPMAGVSPVDRNDPRPLALSGPELCTIRQVLRESPALNVTRDTTRRLDMLLVLLLGTGMRVGEAAALRWSDLQLAGDDPTATITGTLVELKGRGVTRQSVPKTESSNRELLLPPAVVEALVAYRPAGWKPSGWVFPTRSGTVWNTGNAAKILSRVVEVSDGRLEPRRVSFHKFRSTAATAIAEKHGGEVAALVLGHKLNGVTARHYIARSALAPDVRRTLQALVESSVGPGQEHSGASKKRARRAHLRAV